MEMIYTDETLYVHFEERITEKNLGNIKKRVFNIVDEYNINNVIIKKGINDSNTLLGLTSEFKKTRHKNIKII